MFSSGRFSWNRNEPLISSRQNTRYLIATNKYSRVRRLDKIALFRQARARINYTGNKDAPAGASRQPTHAERSS